MIRVLLISFILSITFKDCEVNNIYYKENDTIFELINEEISKKQNKVVMETDNKYENKIFEEENIEALDNNADFYGVWKIEKVALENVWAKGKTREEYLVTSDVDEADYVGGEIEFSPDFLRINDEIYNNPNYIIGSESIDLFNNVIKFRASYMSKNTDEYLILVVDNLYDLIKNENIEVDFVKNEPNSEPEFLNFKIEFDEEDINGKKIPFYQKYAVLNNDTLLLHSDRVLMLKKIK